MFSIIPIREDMRPEINRYIREEWAGALGGDPGRFARHIPGGGLCRGGPGELLGYVLYAVENAQCEILVLHSLRENQGVGRALIQAVVGVAEENRCRRVWLITTNDNIHAIRYYQRVGFALAAVHIGGIEESRKRKPSIPLLGNEGIPIQHEFEFETLL